MQMEGPWTVFLVRAVRWRRSLWIAPQSWHAHHGGPRCAAVQAATVPVFLLHGQIWSASVTTWLADFDSKRHCEPGKVQRVWMSM